jgi:hypothetical protein
MGLPLASAIVEFDRALQELPPAPSALRTAVRVVLGLLILVLVGYIVIEQLGSLRRRRSNRER